jgi:ABC-type nitrate/sulfonate/bicarbonate transport system substrate-binding protein
MADQHDTDVTSADRIVVGSFTPSVLLDLARSTGRLDTHALEVTEVPVASSPAQFRSLLAGEIAVALTSPDNVLAYRYHPGNPLEELLDVQLVAAVDRGLGLGLYAAPGRSAADLRGARVGVDVPTSGFALALYALAESLGVTREEYELVTLGSTPRRLEGLLAGDCDATMLNAGNELVAEAAGCVRLAGVTDVAAPYLGTVLAVAGRAHADQALRLADALRETAAAIVAGELDDEAADAAARRLDLDASLARQYVERLRDPDQGLVPDGVVDAASLRTLVALRQRFLPAVVDGTDVLDAALDDAELVLRP